VVAPRRGRPAVEIKTPAPAPGPVAEADIDWIARRCVGRRPDKDAGELVSEMRDENER
jgi:hypothetical protein